LNLNSNFKIQFKFEKVFNTKLVDLEILKISYLGKFFKLLHEFGSNLRKQFVFEKFRGKSYSAATNGGRPPAGMGAGAPLWPSRLFSCVLGPPARRRASSSAVTGTVAYI
jgi:hypothetical protein